MVSPCRVSQMINLVTFSRPIFFYLWRAVFFGSLIILRHLCFWLRATLASCPFAHLTTLFASPAFRPPAPQSLLGPPRRPEFFFLFSENLSNCVPVFFPNPLSFSFCSSINPRVHSTPPPPAGRVFLILLFAKAFHGVPHVFVLASPARLQSALQSPFFLFSSISAPPLYSPGYSFQTLSVWYFPDLSVYSYFFLRLCACSLFFQPPQPPLVFPSPSTWLHRLVCPAPGYPLYPNFRCSLRVLSLNDFKIFFVRFLLLPVFLTPRRSRQAGALCRYFIVSFFLTNGKPPIPHHPPPGVFSRLPSPFSPNRPTCRPAPTPRS